jgi:transketolase
MEKNFTAMKIDLKDHSKQIRLDIIDTLYAAGKGHIGGSLSCVDILVALYYGEIFKCNASYPKWPNRDRFILSKGHAAIALYCVLANVGFFSKDELYTFNSGGALGEHPDIQIPGIEVNSGSLGHGLGIGAGIAYTAKMDRQSFCTYILLGDGECYEGSIWEAAMFASHHQLDNLIAIIDRNQLCIHGCTEEINKLNSLKEKFHAFGWAVAGIDGHDFDQIRNSITSLYPLKPKVIIANTVKGKGVSFMEGNANWHHGGLTKEQYEQARLEIINA